MSHAYDIAVIGGGLAGLSVLYHLKRAGKLDGKRVVLVDPERKTKHDRTWSFWETGEGPFDALVHGRWCQIALHNSHHHCTRALAPYTYKLIRSTEFYDFVNAELDQLSGLDRKLARATKLENTETGVRFTVEGETYTAGVAFSSLPRPLDRTEVVQPYLDQHFRGWYLRTETDVFDPGVATLMDFRTPQEGETRFFYVLPFTARYAMVEIAIFSNNHLKRETYDRLIETYLEEHWRPGNYRVEHTEQGNIPMTTYPFPARDGNLIYIGLGGGAARPSTGYTFYGLQRQLQRIAHDFPGARTQVPWPTRHMMYDATLLRILQDQKLPGDEVFVDLFRRNPTSRVLAFLNGESSLVDELRLMSTTKIATFGGTFVGEAKKMVLG